MLERACDPECLAQVETHVDNILILKLYEFIIQANIDLSADGVISSSVVAEMLNDDKSSVTENAIRFVWETIRNKMVLKGSLKPDAFPIDKMLAAVPQIYFQTHPEALDTLLQLKDEKGVFVFLGLADFLGRAARVVLVKNIVCQDLCDIAAWLTFNQTITIDDVNNAARAVGQSIVTVDSLVAVSNTYCGMETRAAHIEKITANGALPTGTRGSDGITYIAGGGTTSDQKAVAYATAYGPTSDMGLLTITVNPGLGTTANVNQEGIVFQVSSSEETVQINGGLPAIFSYSKGGGASTFGTTVKMLYPGSGWRFTDAATTAGLLIFNVATTANLLSAGYTAAEIKPEWVHTATTGIVLTAAAAGNAEYTLSSTTLNTTLANTAQGRVGRTGFSLKSLTQGGTPFVSTTMTAANVYIFLVKSSDQASGAKPAIVKVTATDATNFTFTEVMESGDGWYESMALTGVGATLTFTLATATALVDAGYDPLTKYISAGTGAATIAGNQTGKSITIALKQTLPETTGLTALTAVAVAGTGFVGSSAATVTDGQIWFLVSGKDATVQDTKGKPAIFRYEASTATATETTATFIEPGSGFYPSAEIAGNLVWTLATPSNLLANGYVPVDQTNHDIRNRAETVTGNTTAVATRSLFPSNPTYHLKRLYALQAGKATDPATALGFKFATDAASLFGTAANYNDPINGSYEVAPTLATKKTFELLKINQKNKATATQIEIAKLLLANVDVNKPTAFTLIFLNLINSALLKQFFASTTLANIVTFIGVVTASTTPNFNMKYYNILSPVQLSNADISFLYGLFAVLSTLGYLAEEVLKAVRLQLVGAPIANEGGGTLTAPAQITLRANDFDRFWPDYIKSQSVSRRASLFSDLVTPQVPVVPSGALLLANENIAALYQEVYDNSRELKSRYTQLVASNGLPYEQQVAERVTGLTSTGTRSIIGITSIIHNATVTLLKGALLTASSTTTGKAVFLINKDIALTADTRKNIASGDLTLVSTTVGGFASTFITHPLYSNTNTPVLATFTAITLAASGGTQTIYEFSEPIPQSSGFQFGGLVFDEDNLFVKSALFAKHLPEFYTLDNPVSSGAGAPATGPATLTALASRGKYNVTPTLAAGPLTVDSNLYKLYELISVKYSVPLWIVIVAASAGVTTLLAAQQVMIDLFNTILSKKNLVSLVDILSLPKGPWSNGLEPVELLASIIINERNLYIDVKPYIETLLNFAKTHLFDTVRAVNTQGNGLIVKLMESARDDVDRSNILLMMGTTPEIQLANLTNILSLIKMPKIKLFNYYFAQFSMAQLIDGLPLIVASPGTPTATSVCTSYWHTLFNSLEGIKKLQPYVSAEDLLTYERSVKPINVAAGTSKTATTSLTFNPTFIIQAYYPGDTLITGTEKLNALVADMGISFV